MTKLFASLAKNNMSIFLYFFGDIPDNYSFSVEKLAENQSERIQSSLYYVFITIQ